MIGVLVKNTTTKREKQKSSKGFDGNSFNDNIGRVPFDATYVFEVLGAWITPERDHQYTCVSQGEGSKDEMTNEYEWRSLASCTQIENFIRDKYKHYV